MGQEDDKYVVLGPVDLELPKETVGKEMLRQMLSAPEDLIAMIDPYTNEKILYKDYLKKIVNLATALRIQGYTGQEVVLAISSENCLDYFIPQFAALLNCSITAPINHLYTPYELDHVLRISTPKLIFCSLASLPKYIELKKHLNFVERLLVLGKPTKPLPKGVEYMEDFVETTLKGVQADPKTFKPIECLPHQSVALILCSSGTTGLPKGVALSHQCLNVRIQHSRIKGEFESCELYGKQLMLMPFFHGFGNLVTFSLLFNNQTVIVLKRFEEDVFLKLIQDYKIKNLALAPPLLVFLAKSKKVDEYDLSSVEMVACGAAPLSKEVEDQVIKRLNLNTIRQVYGMTEMTLSVTRIPPGVYRPGSSGILVPLVSSKVRDLKTGRSLGPNQIGELCWKGPCMMMGYYNNPKATQDTIAKDGWLLSGDLGYYDEEGFLYVVDRLKELIKYKGFQVAPAELEGLLLDHPKIADAAVVGLPDDVVGERPLGFVVKKPGVELTEEEVKKYVAGLMSPQKQLSGGVVFVNGIPKNPSGKILRRELRTLLKQYNNDLVQIKSKL